MSESAALNRLKAVSRAVVVSDLGREQDVTGHPVRDR